MDQNFNESGSGDFEEQNNRASKAPRELKVEDALLYLDQVKVEFSDKPHIYNEFLEIMKNFKAQSINTPGVIDRVRTLFKGYNKLILGFNTFLPEGYKIELTAEEIASEQAAEAAKAAAAAAAHAPVIPQPPITFQQIPPAVQASQPTVQSAPASQVSATDPATGQPRQPQQMQQQHAITYVTTIRNRFANEPETYRAFLRILHTYQKEQKGIKDVLEQVSHLFADHPDLLMEFTYFLPDAVQDQAKERLHRAAKESEMRRRIMQQQQQQNPHLYGPGGPLAPGQAGQPLTAAAMAALSSSVAGGALKKSRTDRGQMPPGIQGMPGMVGANGHQAIYDAHMLQQQGMNSRKLSSGAAALVQQQPPRGSAKGPKRKLSDVVGPGGQVSVAGLSVSQYNAFIQQQQQQSGGRGMYDPDRMAASIAAAQAAGLLPTDHRSNKINQSRRSDDERDGLSTVHQSVSAERRLFDSIKDFLNSSSREAWPDFVKCLDLFSVDAVSKKDMLTLVQDLFEPGGDDLLDEFKRLLQCRADHESSGQDVWFAMPLSEIDFSQCRKCTPSYRALPLNYPKPQCTDREEAEASVLNDQWVSIPIGSEESYSFKHMRKNQYEEALFKCEDDRFEIDMIIDTNVSAIRVLEPIAEEIANLAKLDGMDNGSSAPGNPKFSFSLEKRNLSTVHLHAITRIYGEHGSEILELLRKNPAGTIPVVLRRLKQKDLEWRKARQELNKQWKDVMEKNFDKSFDHRSFYFKQHDKRAISAKHLLSDIKGTGLAGIEPGSSLADIAPPAEISTTVSPEHTGLLLRGTTNPLNPQLVLSFSAKDQSVHGDVYQIMSHVGENSAALPIHDRERLAACWRDWLRPLFQIPTYLLYPPSSTISAVADVPVDASEAWAVGTSVLTYFGSGKILSFRPSDSMYEVQLSFGKGFLKGASILGAEELSLQALSAIGITKDPVLGQDKLYGSTFQEVAQNALQTSQLSGSSVSNGQSAYLSEPSTIFLGTTNSYTFLRVYHTIFTRLSYAKQLALDAAVPTHSSSEQTIAADLEARSPQQILLVDAQARYRTFLSQLVCLLDGTLEIGRYEESVRQLLGNKGYVLYTLDKVILQAIKMLQGLANDDHFNRLVGIFVYQRSIATSVNTSYLVTPATPPTSSASSSKSSKSKNNSKSASTITQTPQGTNNSQSVGGRRSVNLTNYQNHVKLVTAYSHEDIFRFQFLVLGDCVTPPQLAIQCLSSPNGPVAAPNPPATTGNGLATRGSSNAPSLGDSKTNSHEENLGNNGSSASSMIPSEDEGAGDDIGDEDSDDEDEQNGNGMDIAD